MFYSVRQLMDRSGRVGFFIVNQGREAELHRFYAADNKVGEGGAHEAHSKSQNPDLIKARNTKQSWWTTLPKMNRPRGISVGMELRITTLW